MWLPHLYEPSHYAAPLPMHETRSRGRTLTARRGGVLITGPILNARVRPRSVPLWGPEARELPSVGK
jgi:hypothetical protein